MAQDLDLALRIRGDSAGAEAAVQDTVQELDKLRKETQKPLDKIAAVEQMRRGLDSLSDGMVKSVSQMQKERAELNKLEAELRAAGIDTSKLAAEKTRLEQKSITAARHIANLKDRLLEEKEAAAAAARSTREAGDAMGRSGQQASTGAAGVVSFAKGWLGVGAALQAARTFLDANSGIERLELALTDLTGSTAAARKEIAFIRAESQRLGVEFEAGAESYLTLAAATKGTNLEGQKTRDIWSQVTGVMTRLGASSDDVKGAMIQLAQGASKGKFELEDLKSIAERIPGFFNKAAKAVGVTTEEFFSMVSAGEVTADLLPKIAAGLGALDGEVNTFSANWSRLKDSFKEVFTAIGDTGLFSGLSNGLRYTAVAVLTAWEGFELLGKTLANIAYTIATLDFSGYRKRQQEALAAARADVEKVLERMFPLKESIKGAGDEAEKTGGEIRKAFGGESEASVENLSKAFKEIGLDLEEVRTGISSTERKIIESFNTIARDKNINGEAIVAAYLTAIEKVNSQAAPELTRALSDAFGLGKVGVELFNAALDATVTKTDHLYKNMTDSAIAEQKRLEAAMQASLKRREQIEQDFAKRRAEINQPKELDATFGNLFELQAKARQLTVDAGKATGADAQRLADEALATSNQAADIVKKLSESGELTSSAARGWLSDLEVAAKQSAEALKNVPVTIDQSQAQQQAEATAKAMQTYFDQHPLRVKVVPETGGSGDVEAVFRQTASSVGRV